MSIYAPIRGDPEAKELPGELSGDDAVPLRRLAPVLLGPMFSPFMPALEVGLFRCCAPSGLSSCPWLR